MYRSTETGAHRRSGTATAFLEARPGETQQPLAPEALQASPEFSALRRRQRLFIFPASALFMTSFMTYVLLSAFAHDIVATPVLGLINLGIVLGLMQFGITLAILFSYIWYAERYLDPLVAAVRAQAGYKESQR